MNKPIRRFLDYKYPIGAVIIGYFLIILGIVNFVLTKSIILSLLLLTIGVYLAFSYVGILLDLDNRKFKYFESQFGIKEGDWKYFKYYPYVTLLTINQKQTVYKHTNAQVTTKLIAYRVYLLNEKHTEKILIKEYRNKLKAEKYLDKMANELKLETVVYSPDFS